MRFSTFGILDFFGFNMLSGKSEFNLHDIKRVMQTLAALHVWSDFENYK